VATRNWWRQVVGDFDLEPHHVRLLSLACEAWDRGVQAREAIEEEGAYYLDRHGSPRPHPGLAVERDSRLSFARLIREIDLDGSPDPDPRPPRRH